jgi:hypothetical protein
MRSRPLLLFVRLTRHSRPTGARRIHCDGYESSKSLEIAQGMPDRAGSSPALRGMVLDLNTTTVRHFLHWSRRTLSWIRCQPRHGLF